jgi:hypothetical protein
MALSGATGSSSPIGRDAEHADPDRLQSEYLREIARDR